jgi:hypothetical protein
MPPESKSSSRRCTANSTWVARIKDGLQHADWNTKRDLVRALVHRVEIGPDVTGDAAGKLATTPGAPDFGTAKSHFILRLSAAADRPIFSLMGPGGSAIALDAQNKNSVRNEYPDCL